MSDSMIVDYSVLVKILTQFLRNEVRKVGFQRIVLGLSGGVDSALVATLAVQALGSKNVKAFMMPYKKSSPLSSEHAIDLAKDLSINYEVIDISAMADGYLNDSEMSSLRIGNVLARCRMIVLYDHSAKESALVLGTSNKTELFLGYGTQHGDLASAINPIGDLYKSQVWALSRYLKIPNVIIQKAPSADLWTDQTDEGELGFSYKDADQVLYQLIDERKSKEQVIHDGWSSELVEKIYARIQKYQFKRKLPMIAKISNRSIPHDFLYPRDWGV